MDWLHIFTAGRRTSGNGVEVDFSDDVLAGIAATYDPDVHEAPLVIGHPKLDAPAYGWVGQMRATGERLEVAPVQVEAQFADMVNEGRFKKRSASFYLPTSPRHPLHREGQAAPEFPYLRHVGFLGAAAPAVPGLDREVQFAADEEGVVEVEFASDYAVSGLLKIARRLRDFMVERFGSDEAEKVVPAQDLEWITEAQAYDAAKDSLERDGRAHPTFSQNPAPIEEPTNPDPTPMADPKDTADFAEREAKLKAREEELKAREAKLQAQADEAKRAEIADFADGLASDNARILPRHVPVVT
ncbi:MAG: peptidase, partial [Bacteroidota bacterium]